LKNLPRTSQEEFDENGKLIKTLVFQAGILKSEKLSQ
jgi:hypothetical protein